MKTFNSFKLILPALLVVACANEGSKDPVEDIQKIREQAKLQGNQMPTQAPEKVVYVPKEVPVDREKIVYVPKEVPVDREKIVYVPKEVPVEREKIVYVPKEVPVVQQQTTLNDSYVKIVLSDEIINFYEGKTGVYKIQLRVLDPEIQMKLTAKGLPTGAELKDVSNAKNPNAYELRWTPPYNTLSHTEPPPKVFAATLVPVLTNAKSAKKAETIKSLSLGRTIAFSVFRTQQEPSALVIENLPSEVQEGEVTPFSVIATFPGVDNNSPVKPYIGYYEDNSSDVAGTNLLEMNGSQYVFKEKLEYIGDFKWKFHLLFDTKNIPVQAQKNKSGGLASGNFTQVRVGFRVYGPFNASPGSISRVKINRISAAAPAAVAAPAPAPATETPKAGK